MTWQKLLEPVATERLVEIRARIEELTSQMRSGAKGLSGVQPGDVWLEWSTLSMEKASLEEAAILATYTLDDIKQLFREYLAANGMNEFAGAFVIAQMNPALIDAFKDFFVPILISGRREISDEEVRVVTIH